ncbi:MSHA biogenesis protein MshE [Novimethylophilus kurashikiensis]|uniref:MSHA biogenesis protein MshE n=1 Tax=Novimethylophilus kurashikiensis TaxID=1825523 RepID=A0A2R5F4F4_9PROT|nr:ATPase, T2SS/T4P/T4SS family [Novimethylophilus kurashikiensis]GBG13287.1 MSHA biogenesis protein MshE [Novimethylophilus kurashikiensis]
MSTNNLNWPLAAYAILGEPEQPHPPCTIVLRDATEMHGTLAIFDPDHGTVALIPPDSTSAQNIPIDSIKAVRLTQPIRLNSSTVVTETQGIFTAPQVRHCSLEFKDGEMREIDSFGILETASGLYLYEPAADNAGHFLRNFIPSSAIKNHFIGEPLGKILIEENIATEDHVNVGLQKQQELRNRPLGEYLTEDDIISPDQLVKALNELRHLPMKRLGEALMEAGLITQSQLEAALAEQKLNRRRSLGSILIDMGVVDEITITRILARKLGIPYISLARFNIDPNAIKLVPEAVATKYNLIPLGMVDQRIFVAMENPLLHEAMNEVRFHAKKTAEPVMASGDEIRKVIRTFYGGAKIDDLASELSEAMDKGDDEAEQFNEPSESDNTLTRLVNKIILDAHQQGVSDIHIETYPGKRNSIIRFRKDGVMMHYFNLPANYRGAIVSRLKIMANLDISEKRKGQDGKIDFSQYGPARIELRVATIPTTNGLEDVVLRLLAGGKPLPLAKIGLSEDNLTRVSSLAQRPHGMFLVCGPTGSGKTTTLHSVLGFINNAERKIWTAEDPIEITQEGLRQVQVNPKIGWTFATALRSFLRADPDVIMVGEMRDRETAQIGVEASLTGHMVLSTLHTNSAPESVVRLLDMGVDSFNFADALLGVLAQRLARRLCPECKRPHLATQEELDALVSEYCETYEQAHCESPPHAAILSNWRSRFGDKNGGITLYTAVGCPNCDQTGYKGRLGLHELLFGTPEIRRLIQNRAPVADILAAALDAGMLTLKQDGIQKVLMGDTDIARVRATC